VLKALLNTKETTRDALMTEIEKIESFDGASGEIVYASGKRTPSKPAVLVRMKNLGLSVERLISESKATKP